MVHAWKRFPHFLEILISPLKMRKLSIFHGLQKKKKVKKTNNNLDSTQKKLKCKKTSTNLKNIKKMITEIHMIPFYYGT